MLSLNQTKGGVMPKKNKVIFTIEMPTQEEIYGKIRKAPVPPTQQHRDKTKYRRKEKHKGKEDE